MADGKVLAAQKWVNSTYGAVPNYQPCPEDGLVGWATMNSLIMGLQHELGITPIAAAFGPTTMSRLSELGDIGPGWDKNRNIVIILQHGLCCKGYEGGDTQGTYGETVVLSVRQLKSDMGVGGEGTVQAKVFKAILSMNSYVVVKGGTEKIRAIQRWLNGGYHTKPTFDIGPCDGIHARDTQRALVKAIQYELGIAESSVNGNFGPATQAGLRSKELKAGDSGVFVQLFSAGCVFNEPVRLGPGKEYRATFTSEFTRELGKFTAKFQRFSELQATGSADYQTWAQLLVSMGDPDRPATGCDTIAEITASRAKKLYQDGYRFVGRYLYDPPGSTLDKAIKPGELQTMFDAGLRVFPIYQENARQLADFTFDSGRRQALNAHDRAWKYGFKPGTVIYFAVDYDALQSEIDSAIIPYFRGVADGLAARGSVYVHGVYGSRNVCANVSEKTMARWSYIAGMSWGYGGNLGFPLPGNWAFNQIKEYKVVDGEDSFGLDRDARRTGSDPGQNSLMPRLGPDPAPGSGSDPMPAPAPDPDPAPAPVTPGPGE